jgi:hypothetical protein
MGFKETFVRIGIGRKCVFFKPGGIIGFYAAELHTCI